MHGRSREPTPPLQQLPLRAVGRRPPSGGGPHHADGDRHVVTTGYAARAVVEQDRDVVRAARGPGQLTLPTTSRHVSRRYPASQLSTIATAPGEEPVAASVLRPYVPVVAAGHRRDELVPPTQASTVALRPGAARRRRAT